MAGDGSLLPEGVNLLVCLGLDVDAVRVHAQHFAQVAPAQLEEAGTEAGVVQEGGVQSGRACESGWGRRGASTETSPTVGVDL